METLATERHFLSTALLCYCLGTMIGLSTYHTLQLLISSNTAGDSSTTFHKLSFITYHIELLTT